MTQKPEIRNQKPETRNQKPETRNQKPETRNQKKQNGPLLLRWNVSGRSVVVRNRVVQIDYATVPPETLSRFIPWGVETC